MKANTIVALILLQIINSQLVSAQEWRAKIIDYGIYRVDIPGSTDSEDVSPNLQKKTLITQTDKIIAAIGLNFGLRYLIEGPDSEASIKVKITHPKPLIDPESNKKFNVTEWTEVVTTNKISSGAGWIFEEEWEIVPGEWSMQVLLGNDILVEKKFLILQDKI